MSSWLVADLWVPQVLFLAKRGLKVLLLERDRIGQYASGVNFGNVRRQGRHLQQLELVIVHAVSGISSRS